MRLCLLFLAYVILIVFSSILKKMASKHVLKLSSINDFLFNDNKTIKKGENALESSHVKKMNFDSNLMIIRGEVLASMKNKSYIVSIGMITFFQSIIVNYLVLILL